MNTAIAEPKSAPQQQQQTPFATFRQQLEQRLSTFAEALPPHISPERFKSVINWAVTADPGLLAADRVSLFEACLAAANDGLLPDKKQGALVIYNTKIKEDGKEFWIKKVQWMPMIRGVFDKVYNTGKVKSAKVAIVYGGDRFRTWTDDGGDHIEYEEGDEQDPNHIRSAFALVVMKDGGVFVETMKPTDIEKIRAKSKAANSGPWVDWWEEMAKKSVFRRLAKRLPMARELDAVTSRDDIFEQFADDQQLLADNRRRPPMPPRPPSTMLGASMSKPVPMDVAQRESAEVVDPETGEITEDTVAATETAQDARQPATDKPSGRKAEATSGAAAGGETAKADETETADPPAIAWPDAVGRILAMVSDPQVDTQGRLENLDINRPAYEDALPIDRVKILFDTARNVVTGSQKVADAKRYLESLS